MFTGIIETTARLAQRSAQGGGVRLTIETAKALTRVTLGESIAVNGACMTVTAHRGRRFTVEISPESLRQTTLGHLTAGARVNLERSLRVGDRLGGHFVQGHVDGTGRLVGITPDAAWSLYRFQVPASVAPYLVEKGSIAVNGVSLTVFACRGRTFTVALIPHTLAVTNLADLTPGDAVNIEADVLLKHVATLMRRAPVTTSSAGRRRPPVGGLR